MIYRFLVEFYLSDRKDFSQMQKGGSRSEKHSERVSGKCCSIVWIQFASQGSRFFSGRFYLMNLDCRFSLLALSIWKATESWTFPTIENKLFNLWWSPQKTNDQLIKFLFHWKALHNSRLGQLRTFAVCESINIAREWTWIIRQINYEINHATNCVTETIRTKRLPSGRRSFFGISFKNRIRLLPLHGATHLVTPTWFLQWKNSINDGRKELRRMQKGGFRMHWKKLLDNIPKKNIPLRELYQNIYIIILVRHFFHRIFFALKYCSVGHFPMGDSLTLPLWNTMEFQTA